MLSSGKRKKIRCCSNFVLYFGCGIRVKGWEVRWNGVLCLSMEINRGAARNLECRIYDLQFTMYDFLGEGCKLLLLFVEIGISFYFTQITQIGHADSAELV
jgi:hypothetical protein